MPNQASILIVDDVTNVCTTLQDILGKKGYAATVVNSGSRAVELTREKAFDVILMDIKMPIMDGVEAFKKIKQIRPSAVVIFMTAYGIEDLAKNMIGEGTYAVIERPYDIDKMIHVIEKSMSGFLITLVDPDIPMRDAMQNALAKEGYRVTVCKSGEEAIAFAKAKTSDIFFIDTELPILNGLETYLEIKKENPKATVVLMTAYREKSEKIVSKAIEQGVYSCLYKPFDIEEVVHIIEEIVKKKSKV